MKTLTVNFLVITTACFAFGAQADPISRTGGAHSFVTMDEKSEKRDLAGKETSDSMRAQLGKMKEKTADMAQKDAMKEENKMEEKLKPLYSRTGGGATGLMFVETE